jgi:murein DD-endopeptidase MepM/ murein hydrolase activator NlpD
MPIKPWTDNIFAELRRLRARRTWTEPRPVYVAAGLVITAGVLMLIVVSAVRQPAVPVPTAPLVRQEAPVEPAARSEAPVRVIPAGETVDKAAAEREAAQAPRYAAPLRPVQGVTVQAFGWQYHQHYGDWRYHPGVDIAAPAGSAVKAMWGGRVADVYEDRRYGLTVAVTGGGYTVHYGSLAAAKVAKDQQVTAGSIVGTVGEAPSEPYPHLHLAVKDGGKNLDPQEILAKSE